MLGSIIVAASLGFVGTLSHKLAVIRLLLYGFVVARLCITHRGRRRNRRAVAARRDAVRAFGAGLCGRPR